MLVPGERCAEEATLRRGCAAGDASGAIRGLRVDRNGRRLEVSLSLSLLRRGDDSPGAIAATTFVAPAAAPEPPAADHRSSALDVWARTTSAGVFDLDIRTGRVYFSPEMTALLGQADGSTSVGERDVPQHVYPDDRARVQAAIQRSHDPRGDGMFETEHRIVRTDGEVRWMLVRGRTLFDTDGGERRPARAIGIAYDVTERKRAEEARLKAVLDVSSHRAWECDADGRQFEDAPAWRALTGQSAYVWKRTGWLGAVHPDDRSDAAGAFRKAVASGRSFEGEWRVVAAGGSTHYMHIRAIPLVNDDDTVRGWAGIGEDITERKRAEFAAASASEREREANALLDAIFAAAPIGLGFWDRDLRFRRINDRLAEIHGASAAEHEGKRLDELLPGIEAPEELYLKWHEVLATGEPWLGVEVRGETPARPGQQRTWREDFFPVRVHGEIVGVAAVVQEITERRLAEAQLRESEARFRQLADNAPFMVWVTAPEGACIFVSRSWYDFTGFEPARGLGMGWRGAVHPDDREHFDHAFRNAQGRLEPFRVEFRLRRHDGEYRWVLQAAAPRFSADTRFKGYIGSIIDITERKLAEQALEDSDRRKDEFLALLAHELRNPLAPLTTATELLAQLTTDPMLEDLRQMIERQVNHLTRLVDDLLDTSRIKTGRITLQRRTLDAREIARHSLETSRALIVARQHEVVVIEPDDAVYVDADPVRLAQIVTNLVNNAAKFTPTGGRIELAIERHGGDVHISVRDNGIGIAPESLPHVFERGTRVEELREDAGLGLGLSLVKRLVELHGGTVAAQSGGRSHGATFTVRLPLAGAADGAPAARIAPPEPAASPSTARARIAGRRILIVDDNDDAASSLALLLTQAGHEVCDVRDARSALEIARTFEPHIVLLDIGLPDMDGWELARRLREGMSSPDMKLIAISGYGQSADRRRSRDAGIDHHLTKPVDYAAIAACF